MIKSIAENNEHLRNVYFIVGAFIYSRWYGWACDCETMEIAVSELC